MTSPYLSHFQHEAEKAKGLTETNQGGFAYAIDAMKQLRRFLILGTVGGTFYTPESKLTADNIAAAKQVIQSDPYSAISEIVNVSSSGIAPNNEPALVALALACCYESNDQRLQAAVRSAAFEVLPKVARTGTHLFTFVEYISTMRGWGTGLRRGIANWYTSKTPLQLARQVVKYRQRNGWSHADLLRLSHPSPLQVDGAKITNYDGIFNYIANRSNEKFDDDYVQSYVDAAEQTLSDESEKVEVIRLIREFNLPRETIATKWLNDADVWEALLYSGDGMPITALLRNLGNLSKHGLLTTFSDAERFVVDRVANQEILVRGRVHPIDMIRAKLTYQSGRGFRGSSSWPVSKAIQYALESGFYESFGSVQPSNKRVLLALDVSSSMTWNVLEGISGFTPRVAVAVMAMVTARTEPYHDLIAFSHKLVPLNITAASSINEVIREIENVPYGATECALPMLYAQERRLTADAFVVYTDSETGGRNPSQALRDYRRSSGVSDARLIVNAMTAGRFSIADPTDPYMLDVVGFDSSAPRLMSEFIQGNL